MNHRPWQAWVLVLIGAAIVALAAVVAVNPRIITAYNRGLLGIARGVAEAGAGALAGGGGEERTPVVTQLTQTPASTQTAPTVAVAETQVPSPVSTPTLQPTSTPSVATPPSISLPTIQVPPPAPPAMTPVPPGFVPTSVPPSALATPDLTAPMPEPGLWFGVDLSAIEPDSFLAEFEVSVGRDIVTLRSMKWRAGHQSGQTMTIGPEVPVSAPAPIVWGGKYNGFVIQTQYGELRGWFTSATTAEGAAALVTELNGARYYGGDIEWTATAHASPTPLPTVVRQPTVVPDQEPFVFVRATTTKDVQESQPWDPIDETAAFDETDLYVYAWVYFKDITVPSLCVTWQWHLPDGSFYETSEECSESPYTLGEGWMKYWAWHEISGMMGMYWVDIFAETAGWSEHITTLYFGVNPSAGTAQTQTGGPLS